MTKEITKANILQEMQDKFKLREFEPANFLFSETVIPIYSVEQHLLDWTIGNVFQTITEGGGVEFFKVPDTEKWHINGYSVVFVTGVYSIAGVYILRRPSPSRFLYLDLTAAQTTSYTMNLPKTLTLEPGDSLNINIDGYTSTGSLSLLIDYAVEEIR